MRHGLGGPGRGPGAGIGKARQVPAILFKLRVIVLAIVDVIRHNGAVGHAPRAAVADECDDSARHQAHTQLGEQRRFTHIDRGLEQSVYLLGTVGDDTIDTQVASTGRDTDTAEQDGQAITASMVKPSQQVWWK